jgi:uncharacterized delta-60 repeat protein/uncharacterized repeat protein (TIGR01451 family)
MRVLLTVLAVLSLVNVFGQAGEIDSTFNSDFISRFGNGRGIKGLLGHLYDIALQNDEKIIIAGDFSSYNGTVIPRLARLNPDGSLDTTFHSFIPDDLNYGVKAVALQADGKIIIAGFLPSYAGVSCNGIVRINSDGTIDPTFIIGSGPVNPNIGEQITDVAVTTDQKIIVVGNFTQFNGITRRGVVRLNPDGNVDLSFGSTTGAGPGDPGIRCVTLQPNGAILIGGWFNTYNNASRKKIARLNPDGSLDNSFSPNGGFIGNSAMVSSIRLQPDGKILAAGSFDAYYTLGWVSRNIVRIQSNGMPDSTFLVGTGTDAGVSDIGVRSDGTILLAGAFNEYNGIPSNYLITLYPDGSLADSVNAPKPNDVPDCILVQSDDKVLVGGDFVSYGGLSRGKILRLDANGNLDTMFAPGVGALNVPLFGGVIYDIIRQPDGKILVGGTFTEYNGIPRKGIARIHPNGTLDDSFDPGSGVGSNYIYAIALQPDNKIVVGGNFSSFNGQPANNIIRLNNDGSIDQTFLSGSGYGANGTIWAIALQSSGQLLVGGGFSTYNGTPKNKIARISSDGTTVDPGFSANPSGSDEITGIKVSTNGEIYYSKWHYLYRISSSGTVVNYANFSGNITDFELLPSGKVIVGGDFSGPQRRNMDLSMDFSFTNPNIECEVMHVSAEGNIFLATTGGLRKLDADGITDPVFSVTGTTNGIVYDFAFTDSTLVIVGGFSTFAGQYANCISAIGMISPEILPLQISFTTTGLSCAQTGSLLAQGTAGLPPYTYQWMTMPASNAAMLGITDPGIYTCQITDAGAESQTASVLVNGPSTTGYDLHANLLATPFRPGFASTTWLNAFNDGCTPVSGQLKLAFDPLIDFVSSSPTPSSVSGDTLIWDFTDLTYDSAHVVPQITFVTSTLAAIGDSIRFTVVITPSLGDADTSNNVKQYVFPVVNGYDPNIKSVYPVGKCDERYVEANRVLTYTVQFQNTGNSEAINISVVDSLDTDLDLNTVRIVGKSHDLWTEVLPDNVLKFHFDDIQLPDSTSNETASHGYVIFEVMPLDGLAHGTAVHNKAEIYFDYNPAIVTNAVHNSIFNSGSLEAHPCDLGIPTQIGEQLLLYPNPTNGTVTIDFGTAIGRGYLTVYDATGNAIVRQAIENKSIETIDLSVYENGMYFLTFYDLDGKLIHSNRKISKTVR